MKRLLALFILFSAFHVAVAQKYQVFKGDTINRRDKEGWQQGVWKKYYPGDTLASVATFKDGKHVGDFKTFYKSGKLQSWLKFRVTKAEEISDATMYYENGTVKAKGKYFGHAKDSVWTYYDEAGKLASTEFYAKGKKEGTWKIYYQNGKVSEQTVYKNDAKNGPFRSFYEDGAKKVEATMKNNEYDGLVTGYNAAGKVILQGSYKNTLKEGTWRVYNDKGELEKEEIYKAGKIKNPAEEKEQRLDEKTIDPNGE